MSKTMIICPLSMHRSVVYSFWSEIRFLDKDLARAKFLILNGKMICIATS